MRKLIILAIIVISLLCAGCVQIKSPSESTFGIRSKTSDCHAFGQFYPDFACTPGAINISVTKEELCTPGYTSQVRDVSERTKEAVYAEYSITNHTTGQYEIDHYIPLALGGSNDIANLWPQPAEPRPGYHEKDRVEVYLHDQVCDGKMSLPEAQRTINYEWANIYTHILAAP